MQINTNKTHRNYLIMFSDGVMKIGTTSRIKKRIYELQKQKKISSSISNLYISDLQIKENAFRAERDTCCLLGYLKIGNKREWMQSRHEGDFDFVNKTLRMFIGGLLLNRGARK